MRLLRSSVEDGSLNKLLHSSVEDGSLNKLLSSSASVVIFYSSAEYSVFHETAAQQC